MPDTKDLPAIAWSGFTVYGDDKSIEKVRCLIIEADNVPGLKDQIAGLQRQLKVARGTIENMREIRTTRELVDGGRQ